MNAETKSKLSSMPTNITDLISDPGAERPCLTCVVGWFICPLIGAAIGLTFGYVRESNQPIFGLAYSLESICMTTLLGAILGHIVCRRIRTVPASRKMR